MRFEAPDSTGSEDKLRPYVVVKHRANVILPWSYRGYAVGDGAAGSSHSNVTVGAHLAPPYPAPVLGVDGLIDWAAGRLGLAPGGALSLPFRIDLG